MAKFIWLIVILIILIVGFGAYFIFSPKNDMSDNMSLTEPTGNISSTNSNQTLQQGIIQNQSAQEGQQKTPTSYAVDIVNFAYSPAVVTVHVGDTITWTNKDSAPHTVTSSSGNEMDSARLSNGQTYTHTFDTIGTYDYYCVVHPNMKAKVIVE